MRQGRLLPGKKIVPERIRDNRQPYYEALRAGGLEPGRRTLRREPAAAYLSDLLKRSFGGRFRSADVTKILLRMG